MRTQQGVLQCLARRSHAPLTLANEPFDYPFRSGDLFIRNRTRARLATLFRVNLHSPPPAQFFGAEHRRRCRLGCLVHSKNSGSSLSRRESARAREDPPQTPTQITVSFCRRHAWSRIGSRKLKFSAPFPSVHGDIRV